MGNLASPESLLARWQEMQEDPTLRDLPYKIELNAWGKVEMSPASEQSASVFAVAVSLPDPSKGYRKE